MVEQVAKEAKNQEEGKIPEEVRTLESDVGKQYADVGTKRPHQRSTVSKHFVIT